MKPSVTNLLSLLDKPALLKWANKIGLEGIHIDDYRSKAKDSGTSIHEAVENYLKFKILPDDEALAGRIKNFFADKEILEVEKSIETEWFIGRYDVKLKWKDFVFICDLKSNSKVYLETKLQLSAYKMADECDHVAVIHLPDFLIQPVSTTDYHEGMIIKLSELFQIKHKLENSK